MRFRLEPEAPRGGPYEAVYPPTIYWEQGPADNTVLHFCGGELIGSIGGMIPRGKNTQQIRSKLYEGMYNSIRNQLVTARRGRGIRLIMADRANHGASIVCVENFAKWLKKRWPGQMTETRVCKNPNSGNPTKVWVFKIP